MDQTTVDYKLMVINYTRFVAAGNHHEAAKAFGVHPRTVGAWIKEYENAQGAEERNMTEILEAQRRELLATLSVPLLSAAKELEKRVQEEAGAMSIANLLKIVKVLGDQVGNISEVEYQNRESRAEENATQMVREIIKRVKERERVIIDG